MKRWDNLPRGVKIGPLWYSVGTSSGEVGDTELHGVPDSRVSLGATNHNTSTIVMRDASGMSWSQARDTLWHEIMHGAMFSVGVNLPGRTEERVIAVLGPILLGVLRDNPRLVAFLTSKQT